MSTLQIAMQEPRQRPDDRMMARILATGAFRYHWGMTRPVVYFYGMN